MAIFTVVEPMSIPSVIWLEKPEFEYDETKILNYMLKICKEKGIL